MEKRYNPTKCGIETRADGKPVIVGYGAVFHRADDPGTQYELWRDTIERVSTKAFDQAMKRQDDTRALFNHDMNHILGRTTAGTMRLSVDSTGLRYEIDPPDTETGRSVVESIKRGDVSGSSFSFSVDKESWESRDGKQIRTLESVTLFDVGPVTFPAYESASTAVRSEGDCNAAREAWQSWQASMRERRLRELRLEEAAK